MSINKSVFRAEDEDHADAIVEAIKACNFPTLTIIQSSKLHPGVSEFSVVVILDADADGWVSDLNGVLEAVIETPPPAPQRYHWISRRLSAPATVAVTRIGPCTASKAAEVATAYGSSTAQAFDNPQDALDWVSSQLVSKE